jgi:HlyD family secretion protein
MSAEVVISLPRRESVLSVPTEAVTSEEGHDVCFVVHQDGLERREVRLGQVTRELAEVTGGLHEGELVALNPVDEESRVDPSMGSVEVSSADSAASAAYSSSVIAASN